MAYNVRLDLDEEERLPWLEPVEEEDDSDGLSAIRLLGFIVVGLFLLGIVIAGLWWLQNRPAASGGGEGQLIAAPAGGYKERPSGGDSDAKTFSGEGDASYAASEGAEPTGTIDERRVPETPVVAVPSTPTQKPVQAPSQTVTARVSDATGQTTTRPNVAPTSRGSAVIQLGAYGSRSVATDAWAKLGRRFPYLSPLTMAIEPVEVGGSTLYRLRAVTGSAAEAGRICGKLKVAGENCLFVR